MTRATCPTCATVGRRGYCAPSRCYCGHRECHAYATWVPRIGAIRDAGSPVAQGNSGRMGATPEGALTPVRGLTIQTMKES